MKPRSAANVGVLLCVAIIALFFTTSASAQLNFQDFSNASALSLNGSATTTSNGNQTVLRLTKDGVNHVSGTAWYNASQQSVQNGFTTVFQFQITHTTSQADGLTFVIQNSSGDGFGLSALGGSGGAIGYGNPDPGDTGTPIPNSLAIEFDTYQNGWDPNNNHIAVQSCGTDPNTQHHDATCPTSGLPSNLGIIANPNNIIFSDGAVHTATIDYDPPSGDQPGTLRVFLDNAGSPVLVVNTDLGSLLSLNDGTAWVGFTASTGGEFETHDILNWTFTPATAQTSITQTLTPDVQASTNYVFGTYNHKVSYSGANADTVTVTAIPIAQNDFFTQRLQGSTYLQNHPNTQCAIYEGTGGECVYFSVNCQGSSDCTQLSYDLFNNFNTSQAINGACLLKAPIGTNNWTNIIETFTQTRNDPGTTSKSNGFSDFFVGQNCTNAPTININTPANGGVYPLGPLTVNFGCTPDSDAANVTVTSCTGTFNGNPVNNGDTIQLTTLGPASFSVNAVDSVGNSPTQVSLFNVGQAPAITSGASTTFQVGVFGSFTVTTTGSPSPALTETGTLPAGVSFTDNGNGTGTLAGTPGANTGGTYNLTFKAANTLGNASQNFVLTVNQTPAFTSASSATFTLGTSNSFKVQTTGFPTASITKSGSLPAGVTFTDNGNGTATLAGTPTATGTFPLTFTATNAAGTAMQNFTLTVAGPQVSLSPSSVNFGTVNLNSLLYANVTVKNTGSSNLQISKVSITYSGSDADDFGFLNFCPSSLGAGKSCIITIWLWADDLGTRAGTLKLTDNAPGSPQQVALSANVVKKK
ncbi:MAG TPA: choice-of-anchor D domain-containing protein [Terriglobales bacterium]|nr:choice-of-anchor D domain-containing protein [Terriglobales bacterium]